MKYLLIIGSFIFISAIIGQTKKLFNHSVNKQVIELFTSEGCSSCPAAEQYAEELAKDTNIIVLSYHVDYWNRLGWVDSFSNHLFSQKQYQYAKLFHLSSVYTPQAVINGKAEAVGSNRKLISQLLQATEGFDRVISTVQISSNANTISVIANTNKQNISLEFLLVQKEATTHVLAGENDGSTLHHINIVRQLTESKNNNTVQFNWKNYINHHNFKMVILARDNNTNSIKDVVVTAL